ncbi:hypothetical protein PSEUDO9AG_70218 [Pseudomonas sp. 9Ag]|nr:hypothetical protein PSEUDO9AG_70218 [Pseudomonas sp. 9Ag]
MVWPGRHSSEKSRGSAAQSRNGREIFREGLRRDAPAGRHLVQMAGSAVIGLLGEWSIRVMGAAPERFDLR